MLIITDIHVVIQIFIHIKLNTNSRHCSWFGNLPKSNVPKMLAILLGEAISDLDMGIN